MASISERTSKAGTSYVVRWRDEGRGSQQRTVTVALRADAEKFVAVVEAFGGRTACEMYDRLDVYTKGEPTPVGPTLSEFLTAHVNGLTGVEKRTRSQYRDYIRKDIDPVIGMMPVDRVTRADIRRWVQHMEESGAAGKTMKNKHGFVSGVFNAAITEGTYSKANPCVGVAIKETETGEMVFLTQAEYQTFLAAFTDRYKPVMRFLVASGVRFSEMAALRPSDVDYQTGSVRISRAWKKVDDAALSWELGPPKTKKSKRTIVVPVDCLPVVPDGQEYLFVNTHGNPLRSTTFGPNVFKKTLARLQKADKTFTKTLRVHDMRHTCASWMIQAGVPLPVIQRHLGHESIQTTVDRYGHLDQSAAKLAADAMAAMLGGMPDNVTPIRKAS
ncbi:tyrosine-type recombinase/integrase [Mycolicibacterium llatzerense]|uniref:tyrosine-type recombinase/integrase n=1 Tax=Mycolicibacterium llatzerense TaxID=280871 RepID=UPI0005C69E72|nr:site-specific integrase [Mycolicibacterium llatzerense]MCT7371442.1 hypothetical protein [Mycolicibacterium llatzerense]